MRIHLNMKLTFDGSLVDNVDLPVSMSTVTNPPPWDRVVQDGQAEIKELSKFSSLIDNQMTSELRIHRKPSKLNFMTCKILKMVLS